MGKKHSANPTDTFRKEQRKKEIKKNKTNRKTMRETGEQHRDWQRLTYSWRALREGDSRLPRGLWADRPSKP